MRAKGDRREDVLSNESTHIVAPTDMTFATSTCATESMPRATLRIRWDNGEANHLQASPRCEFEDAKVMFTLDHIEEADTCQLLPAQ